MGDEAPAATTSGVLDALTRYDHKMASGNKVDEAMFSSPLPGDKGQKLLLGPMKLKGVSADSIFQAVFSSTSTFLREYHEKRGDTDNFCPPWSISADRSCGVRMFSCTTLVDHPRAGTPTPFNEAHRYVMYRDGEKKKLLVQLSAQTPNVPFGTSFRVETWMHFEEDGEGNVDTTIYGQTKKMSFAFSAIGAIATPRAIRELKQGYVMFMEMLSERLLSGQDVLGSLKEEVAHAAAAAASVSAMSGALLNQSGSAEAGALRGATMLGADIDLVGAITVAMAIAVAILLLLSSAAHSELQEQVVAQRRVFTKFVAAYSTSPSMGTGAGSRHSGARKGVGATVSQQPSVLDSLLEQDQQAGLTSADHSDDAVDSVGVSELAKQLARLQSATSRSDLSSSAGSWLSYVVVFQGMLIIGGGAYALLQR